MFVPYCTSYCHFDKLWMHRTYVCLFVEIKCQLDWKKAFVIPIFKGGDRSVVRNYRPFSLTSVVCKQMEHVIAGYLRYVWEMSGWLYEGQHGFRPGYSCESQVVMVC